MEDERGPERYLLASLAHVGWVSKLPTDLAMSYGTLVNQLTHSLGGHIIAYDNLPGHAGRILYLDGHIKRIDVDIAAIDAGVEELTAFLRQMIEGASRTVEHVAVDLRDGKLTVA